MSSEGLMVFTGNANPKLAEAVVKHLGIPLGKALVGRFSDGEVQVEIQENVRGKHVFILQSTCAPTNDNLMELMVMVDALKRASARRITAAIPYFGYARQDRRPRSARVAITAKVVANMLEVAGVERVLTMDLHADQIQGFFDIPVDNIYASPILLEDLRKKNYEDLLVVSPDVGGVVRARALAKRLGPARGWDVLMSGVIEPLLADPKAAPGIDRAALERLASLARAAGAGPAREAMAAILAPGCTTTILSLAAWLEHGRWMSEADGDRRAALSAPVTTLAGGWLAARMAKLGKAARPPEDAKGRDKLRRRLRTLRYTADFFRGLYPEAATLPFFAALEPLQTALDADQDAVTGARMLGSLTGADPKTVGAVAAWIDRQSDKRRKALPDLWKRFRAVPPFWS